MNRTAPHISLNWVALLRIMMGLVFLTTWGSNLLKGNYTPEGYVAFIQHWAADTAIAPYQSFLLNVVIPNAEVLRRVQVVLEPLVMGLFLLVGLFTPASAATALLFVINLGLASFGTAEWPWTYVMMAALLTVIGATRAGRAWGLDALLTARRGEPPVPYLW